MHHLRANDWPQWRGPHRDGVSRETGLLRQWPRGGPRVAWQVDHIGLGFSSIAVKDGRIFTLGDRDGVEHVLCLRVSDGGLIWAVQPEPAARRLQQRVAEALQKLDANRDGRIEEAEALAELDWQDLGDYDQPGDGDAATVAAARATRLLAALDKDGDGRISFDETRRGQRRLFPAVDAADNVDAAALSRRRTDELFRRFDKDKNGRLTYAEAAGSCVEFIFYDIDLPLPAKDEGDRELTPEEVADYLLTKQRGKDGYLTAAELRAFFKSRWPGRDGILSAAELRSAYGGFRDDMGTGPRSTPLVAGGRVYSLGCLGDLSCLDAADGHTLWAVNLIHDFAGRHTGRGYCESPVLDGDRLLVTPGGAGGTVLALDKRTGKQLWRSQQVTEPIHYGSGLVADIAGVRTFVQFASKGVFGLDVRNGTLLWRYARPNSGTANIGTPIVWEDRVFAASSYNTGGGLARIVRDGLAWKADELWFQKKMTNHHGGVVRVGDFLYGFNNTQLLCLDFKTGKVVWSHRSVGKGSLTAADGLLFLLGERGDAALAEATPEGYREHGRLRLQDLGQPLWSHPVVSGGRLYLRNQQRLTAYDIRAQAD